MAKRGGFPGGMPGNMNNLMKQAQKMQKQMEENQKALEEKEFTATAGGGAVEVTVSGKREVVKVKLSEEAVDPDDVETVSYTHLDVYKRQVVKAAVCGVTMTLSMESSGLSLEGRFPSKTSRAAPQIRPFFRQSIRAVSSTTSPRPVLIR